MHYGFGSPYSNGQLLTKLDKSITNFYKPFLQTILPNE